MLPKLTDYWDELAGATDEFALKLLQLDDAERARAAVEIVAAVREHVRVMPDELLIRSTVPVLDDLYKAACAATRWDVGLATYLEASAGTFMAALAERGFRCQYLVDNAWADLARPFELFPSWYRSAGLVYACPQLVARDLMTAGEHEGIDAVRRLADRLRGDAPDTGILAAMPAYIEEARDVIDELLVRCAAEHRHFFQLDTDFVGRSFAKAFEHAGAVGVLTVLRNLAPEPGSNIELWLPEGFSWT